MSKKLTKKLKNFTIQVYEDAEKTVEQILVTGINDFKRIITSEAQRAGDIADPHIHYDRASRMLVIEQFQEDRGRVFVLSEDDDGKFLELVSYKDVPVQSNYAQLDSQAGCYRVYVKQEKVDHPVNVALDEDTLLTVFEQITHADLLPAELDMEIDSPMEVVKEDNNG